MVGQQSEEGASDTELEPEGVGEVDGGRGEGDVVDEEEVDGGGGEGLGDGEEEVGEEQRVGQVAWQGSVRPAEGGVLARVIIVDGGGGTVAGESRRRLRGR